jgi:hypothetical protein
MVRLADTGVSTFLAFRGFNDACQGVDGRAGFERLPFGDGKWRDSPEALSRGRSVDPRAGRNEVVLCPSPGLNALKVGPLLQLSPLRA